MHLTLLKPLGPAAVIGVAAVACLSSGRALAAPESAIVRVPCNVAALAGDISTAVSGQTLNLAPSCRYLLSTALPDISVNLTINGNDATLERSNASGTPAFSLLVLTTGPDSTSSQDVAINHLNFRNGDSQYGGALYGYNNSGQGFTVTVTGGSFTSNTATADGGAIYFSGFDYVSDAGLSVTIAKASFTSNTAAEGGAIAANGDNPYKLTVTGDTFIRNTANPGSGGAIDNESNLTVNGGSFTGNTAMWGGAIASASDSDAEMTVNDAMFARNTATYLGGALYNWDGLSATSDILTGNSAETGGGIDNEWYATVSGITFRRNKATTGGGMFNGYNASVSDSSFDHNQAITGGGIANGPGDLGLTPTMTVTGSHLTGNTAATDGGGIANGPGEVAVQVRSTISIASSSITGNTAASDGGGIYTTQPGNVTLTTSTVNSNRPDNCAPPDAVIGCTS